MQKLQLPETLKAFAGRTAEAGGSVAPWEEKFRSGDYQGALAAAESGLSEQPNAPSIKLWWVLIQLELGQVPLAALASPVTEIVPSLASHPDLYGLAMRALLSLAARLAEKGQLRLGLSIVESASDLAETSGVLSGQERTDLFQYTLAYFDEELARAKGRRESRDYLARLEKRFAERKERKPAPQPVEAKKPRQRKPSFSSKALFEQALRSDEPQEPSVDAASIDETPLDFGDAAKSEEQEPKLSKPIPNWLAISGGLVLLFMALFVVSQGILALFRKPVASDDGLVLAMQTSGPTANALALPSLELSRHDLLAQKFETINTNLEKVGERIKNIGGGENGAQEVDHQALEASADSVKEIPSRGEDELVPIEGPGSPAASGNAAPLDPARTPKTDPGAVANIPVQDLGRTAAPQPKLPQLKVGNDGRLYGPPAEKDPALEAKAGDSNARALDGTPLRSYEVQQYEEPRLYKTLVPTNVLSAPSLLSTAVSRLDRDTTVQVVSKMGQWLELRSTQGRRGYIFAQDAEEIGAAP